MPSTGLRRLNPALPLSEIYGPRRRVLNDCFIMLSLAVTSQIVGHGKSAGNRVTGMATHTNIVVVQIPHHH